MAFLPPHAVTLQGGCLCSAIRYTVNIPELESRSFAPNAVPTPVPAPSGQVNHITTRLPLIEIDHCSSCRRAAGSIIQCWIVGPKSWVSWKLINRANTADADGNLVQKPKDDEYQDYTTEQIVLPSADILKSTYLAHFESSKDVHRAFCGRCGTSLTYYYAGPRPGWTMERNFDVALGTLDRESLESEGLRPERHGWWSDGVSWVRKLLREGDQVEGMRLVRHKTGAMKDCMDENDP